MYFNTSCGWLRYGPFTTFSLPHLVPVEGASAVFKRKQQDPGDSESEWHVPLYRLEWPGWQEKSETSNGEGGTLNRVGGDGVPKSIYDGWPDAALKLSGEAAVPATKTSLGWIHAHGLIPDEPPESVAYHLAVNAHAYTPDKSHSEFPVAGLPARRVAQVLGTEFAIKPDQYATLQYLKWHAESHREHPLFRGFDTMIREELIGLSIESAWLYFQVLGDLQYDRETCWWSRKAHKQWYARLATYLFWVGRTGQGLYEKHANIRGSKRESMREDMPDFADRQDLWHTRAMDESRAVSRTERETPARSVDESQPVA